MAKKHTPTKRRGDKGVNFKPKKVGTRALKTGRNSKASVPIAGPGGRLGISRTPRPVACIDLIAAGEIVQEAVPGGPNDVDSTLEDAGLITANQRAAFRADVVNGVSERGCAIDGSDVPNGATTTLREARLAIKQNAR